METQEQHSSPAAELVPEPDRADGRPAGDEEISGLIRRVRRLAKLSQRELAHDLGVSQSAVAKWETGRTSPSARMLRRVLDVAKLRLVAVRQGGQQQGGLQLGGLQLGDGREGERVGDLVKPMKTVAARDAAGRRYPAHTFVWAEGWWAPEGSETTAWYDQILCRSEDLELPRVRYSRWWQLGRPPTMADINDHPTWPELVAEAREAWRPPRRHMFPIPEWAFADTKKSRNRRPEDFRALARTVSLARSSGLARRTSHKDEPQGRARHSSRPSDVSSVEGMTTNGIEVSTPPSGSGCAECDEVGGWWVHLRRCAQCGHVGCCDSSPAQHATAHFRETGHPVVQSFEPGESWFWDYAREKGVLGPELAPPTAHPDEQPTPGPAGRVPADWREHVHS